MGTPNDGTEQKAKIPQEVEKLVNSGVVDTLNKEIEAQVPLFVQQAIKDLQMKEIDAALLAAFTKFGYVEYKQMVIIAAKILAHDLVKLKLEEIVGPMTTTWVTNEICKEIVGPKAIRDALRSIATPRVTSFTIEEIRRVGPGEIKDIIVKIATPQCEAYVDANLPLLATGVLHTIVKNHSEKVAVGIIEDGLKKEVQVQVPVVVADLIIPIATNVAKIESQKVASRKAPAVVDEAFKEHACRIVGEVTEKVAIAQAPSFVSQVVKDSPRVILGIVTYHIGTEAVKQAPEIVSHSFSAVNVSKYVIRGVKYEVRRKAPEIVSSCLERDTVPIVLQEFKEVAKKLVEEDVSTKLQKMAPELKETLNECIGAVSKVKVPEAVVEMIDNLESEIKSAVLKATSQATQKQVTDFFAHVLTTMSALKVTLRSLKKQLGTCLPKMTEIYLEENIPRVLNGKIEKEADAQLKSKVSDIIILNESKIENIILKDVVPVSLEKLDTAILGLLQKHEGEIVGKVENRLDSIVTDQSATLVSDVIKEQRERFETIAVNSIEGAIKSEVPNNVVD